MSAITSQIVERHGMSKDGGKMFPMLVTVKVGVITGLYTVKRDAGHPKQSFLIGVFL